MRAKGMGTAVIFMLVSLAYAGPETITYQGSLLNHLGGPVTNGTYRMAFGLHDVRVGSGAYPWHETKDVQVTNGLFSIVLGDDTPFGGVFTTYPDLWLEVVVDLDGSGTFEPSEIFNPRQNLNGVPWACPRLEPNAVSPNLVGGYSGNTVTSGVCGGTIGGGGYDANVNRVTDNYGTVGGGIDNQAGDDDGTPDNCNYTTVGGGQGNTASAIYATVPGGRENSAGGPYSFAAGRQAKAQHGGAFVWADNAFFDFASTRTNQFNVRARGGARFVSAIFTSGAPSAGVVLSSGGSSWSSLSDRNLKENFTPVDGQEILSRLAEIPISTWNYKAQDSAIRHIGPTAQDFRAAFGVGEDARRITTIDADGVALAAIQGLYQILQEKDAEIATLREKNSEVQARLATLEALVERMAGQRLENGQ